MPAISCPGCGTDQKIVRTGKTWRIEEHLVLETPWSSTTLIDTTDAPFVEARVMPVCSFSSAVVKRVA